MDDIFGILTKRMITTDAENLEPGDEITLLNSNCEFEFDNVFGIFEKNLLYYYIADLEIVDTDLSEYRVEKSNNGGAYAYATCKVVKVYEKSY